MLDDSLIFFGLFLTPLWHPGGFSETALGVLESLFQGLSFYQTVHQLFYIQV